MKQSDKDVEKAEARIQSDIFMWHWNTYPNERMRLYMVHNTPKNDVDGARLKGMGMVSGVSDLCFICSDGKTAYLEIKTPTGTQSPNQKKFQAVCKSLGVTYLLIRSLEEGQAVIEKYR